MPSSFPYDSVEYVPPAPVVPVVASVPWATVTPSAQEFSALCDTGADLTFVPTWVIEKLGLVEVDEIQVRGYEGPPKPKPIFAAHLTVVGSQPKVMRVSSIDTARGILGRDILNSLRLGLNGPESTLVLY